MAKEVARVEGKDESCRRIMVFFYDFPTLNDQLKKVND